MNCSDFHPSALYLIIDCIGIRIIYPVAASLVAEVSGVSLTAAITYSGWMMASYAIMQFIFSPILGGLSDQFSRRPVLLISLMGLGINYFLLALANTLPLLFLGRIIAGICGSSLTTGFAYVADISLPEKRAQNFGIIGAAIGLGFIIGPFLGGVFSQFGTRVPFIAAACLCLVNWLYGFFILPESLPKESRRTFNFRRASPFGAFVQLKKNKAIRMLLLVLFFLFFAGQVMPSIWPFYTKYLYKWSDLEIGYSLAFVGIMVAIVKGGLLGWIQKKQDLWVRFISAWCLAPLD
jgi:MFS transporter, DHA1 family, tetracycline resistance protein